MHGAWKKCKIFSIPNSLYTSSVAIQSKLKQCFPFHYCIKKWFVEKLSIVHVKGYLCYKTIFCHKVAHVSFLRYADFCVCVKCRTFCNCLCSSSCFSLSLIQNIGDFGAKNYFTDHQTANAIHSFRDSIPPVKIYGCY